MATLFMMVGAAFIVTLFLWVFTWVIYVILKNAGVADIAWGMSCLVIMWIYLFFSGDSFPQYTVLLAMGTLWGLRLTTDLSRRFHKKEEDPRYQRLREQWGGDPTRLIFLTLFLFQGLLTLLITLPFLLVAFKGSSHWSRWEFVGIALWVIGLLGESVADRQLFAFRVNPENRGQILEKGLWRYSRHPNYFFEFLVWLGFAFFSFPVPGGLLGFISPILMYVLLVHVSGIPLTEAHSLEVKGDAYVQYQKKTSKFFPWFPDR